MRYLMTISYDGKNYSGWQRQPNANSIQQELETAIKTLTKQEINCVASGRTDAKVSAYAQMVHFDIEKKLDENKFIYSINGILPEDIRVLDIKPTTLHARFDAKRKTYIYKMYISQTSLPLQKDALQISENLDFKSMKKFIKLIKGTHDFAGFRASGSETETSVRTIYSAKLKRENNYLNFEVTSNGFLYKMVRNIVGTILKIGEKKLDLSTIKSTLFTKFKATYTAPPEFLYLKNVKY